MTRLLDDRRGAFMVMGLFMAVIAAGAMFYLIGIGEALVMKERMQDAADATAYSAAAIHARGMNILVLFNMIMALVMAILIIFKILLATVSAAKTLASVACFFTGFACLSLAPLHTLESTLRTAEPKIEKIVDKTLTSLDSLSDVVRKAVPAIAFAKSLELPNRAYDQPADLGVVFPLYQALPAREGPFKRICEKGGEYVGTAVGEVLEKFGLGWDTATDFLADLVSDAAGEFSSYLCGDEGARPPSVSYEIERAYPEVGNPHVKACEDGDRAACDRAKAFAQELDRAFDVDTGECVAPAGATSASPAELKQVCEKRLSDAREHCKPGSNPDGKVQDGFDYWLVRYEELEYVYELKKLGDAKVVFLVELRHKPIASGHYQTKLSKFEPNFRDGFEPCQTPPASVGGGHPWTAWATDLDLVLCDESHDEPTAFEFGGVGDQVIRRVVAISDVVACVDEQEQTVELGGNQVKFQATYEEICDCAELGEERFQLRAWVIGDNEDFLARTRKQIEVANLIGHDVAEPDLVTDLAQAMGHVSVAQAEFFYGGGQARDEWMWHLEWKARLRRVELAELVDGGTCAKPTGKPAAGPHADGADCRDRFVIDQVIDRLGQRTPLGKGFGFVLEQLDKVLVH